MPRLLLKENSRVLGAVSDADVKVLIDELEEEDTTDDDYFVDSSTVSILEAAGASSTMVEMLLAAIGDSDGIEIRWET